VRLITAFRGEEILEIIVVDHPAHSAIRTPGFPVILYGYVNVVSLFEERTSITNV